MARDRAGRREFLKGFSERHPYLVAGSGFAVLTTLFFSPALFGDFIVRDVFHEYYPLRVLYGWMREGEFALWNPHTVLGAPLAGSVFAGIFYPLNLLLFPLLRLPADYALRLYILLHYVLAGVGMVFMLRQLAVRDEGAWTGAVAYAFSGYLVSQHYAVNLLPALALTPLAAGMMMRARTGGGRRWCGFAGVAAGLIFLGGDPQGFALALAIGVAAVAVIGPEDLETGSGQEGLAGVGLGLGIGIFLLAALVVSAAELVPALPAFRESGRGQGLPPEIAACWSFNPLRVLELFVARPFGNPWPLNRYWGEFLSERCFPLPLCVSPYLGVWTLVAAAAALRRLRGFGDRRVIFFTALLVIFLALALGRFSPVYRLLFAWLPGLSALRYPEKYLAIITLALAALTGIGTDLLIAKPGELREEAATTGPWVFDPGLPAPKTARRRPFSPLLLPGLALALTVVFWTLCRMLRGDLSRLLLPFFDPGTMTLATPAQAASDLVNAFSRTGLFLSLALFARAAVKRPVGGWITAMPAIILFLDLWQANAMLAPTTVNLYRMESPLAELILTAQGEKPRDRDGTGTLAPPCCAASRYRPRAELGVSRIFRDPYIPSPVAGNYEENRRWERETLKPNLGMIEGFEYFAGLNVAAPARFERMAAKVITFDRLPIYNVQYAVVAQAREPRSDPAVSLLGRYRGASLLEFSNPFPRAYWVGAAKIAHSDQELAALFAGNDFRSSVILEPKPGAAAPPPESGPAPGLRPAEVVVYSPNRVEVNVDAPRAGWLVLNDLDFPGWQAKVDGKPAAILRANGLVRAIPILTGSHAVVFTFQPAGLRSALLLSALSLLLGAIGFIFFRES